MQIQSFPDGIPGLNDLILFQDVADNTYRKARFNQLAGKNEWKSINSNYSASNYDKLIDTASGDITITLPIVTIGEIEIFNTSGKAFIDTQGKPYNGVVYQSSNLILQGTNKYFRLVYINDSVGWYPLAAELDVIGVFAGGASLILEGILTDTSGNNRSVTPTANSPLLTTGFDDRPTIRFTESSVQELTVSPFLSGTTGATLYIVFCPNNDSQYNLIRTANLDDYWRFSGNGAGYFGTFRSSRFEAYPLNMPTSGNHLISIHANASSYEVIQNNTSKGSQPSTYAPGDRFIIAAENQRYSGDISLVIAYPFYIAPSANTHTLNVQTIKSKFPSLPFTL
ncbi:hypothetical protein NOS3756_27390 [Nostoc sp. NIES-3756]|uniref:hypothetical protein n=1 Tax=Nostoc sp. NIES-3756 TaxID=1751286 RepID=UPI00071F5524|nr:hypothetical protein [Nostoc sp. NIES-3756]BAT53776.1 hypothetical protein NOS3756_27390 [Nostoc sp. NIES-3756]